MTSNCSAISRTLYRKIAERSVNGKGNTLITEEPYLAGGWYPLMEKKLHNHKFFFFLKKVNCLMKLKSCKPWPL